MEVKQNGHSEVAREAMPDRREFLALAGASLVAACTGRSEPEVEQVKFDDLIRNPAQYAGKEVSVTADVSFVRTDVIPAVIHGSDSGGGSAGFFGSGDYQKNVFRLTTPGSEDKDGSMEAYTTSWSAQQKAAMLSEGPGQVQGFVRVSEDGAVTIKIPKAD